MKSVLISIKSKWCELIASGPKTIEVRKTRPAIEKVGDKFKCYIYETKDIKRNYYNTFHENTIGKVIGEFICDEVGEAHWLQDVGYCSVYKEWKDTEDCLSNTEILEYMGEKDVVYGWHISALKIYDKPKELKEFYKLGCLSYDDWLYGIYNGKGGGETENYLVYNARFKLNRPPQSWCYVNYQGDE